MQARWGGLLLQAMGRRREVSPRPRAARSHLRRASAAAVGAGLEPVLPLQRLEMSAEDAHYDFIGGQTAGDLSIAVEDLIAARRSGLRDHLGQRLRFELAIEFIAAHALIELVDEALRRGHR